MDTAIVIAIIAAIISPPLTVGIPLAIFQWRQNTALEKRLTANIESVENRLRTEIQTVKSDLGTEIQTVKSDLGTEIQTVKSDLGTEIKAVENRLNHRIDEVEERLTKRISATDNNVIHLIGEVGLVKGAVLGISTEGTPREPVTPN